MTPEELRRTLTAIHAAGAWKEADLLQDYIHTVTTERDIARGLASVNQEHLQECVAERDAAVREAVKANADAAQAEADNAAKTEAVSRYFYERGAEHDNVPGTDVPCPEDDTCKCPRIMELNDAFGLSSPGRAIIKRLKRLEAAIQRAVVGGMDGVCCGCGWKGQHTQKCWVAEALNP